jgi:hypothetical protein
VRDELREGTDMSEQKSMRNIFLGALITFIFGVLMFFLQQHYKTRELENERDEKAHSERAAALRDFSKACSNLAGAASEMERETKFYLSRREKELEQPAIAAMDHFFKQLVILDGIGGAAAPLFNFKYELCGPPPQGQNTTNIERLLARARCEVSLCSEQQEIMSSYLRRK